MSANDVQSMAPGLSGFLWFECKSYEHRGTNVDGAGVKRLFADIIIHDRLSPHVSFTPSLKHIRIHIFDVQHVSQEDSCGLAIDLSLLASSLHGNSSRLCP